MQHCSNDKDSDKIWCFLDKMNPVYSLKMGFDIIENILFQEDVWFFLDMISGTNCFKNSLMSDLKLLHCHRMSNSIAWPQLLLTVENEFLDTHDQMFSWHNSTVFGLAHCGVLSIWFLWLNDTPSLCASFLLGQAHHKSLRCKSTTDSEWSFLRNSTMSKSGDGKDVDDLISAQHERCPHVRKILWGVMH